MEITEAVVVPVIIVLTEVLKRSVADHSSLVKRLTPLVSIILGLLIAFLIFPSPGPGTTALKGILYGASASGLYSGLKAASGK